MACNRCRKIMGLTLHGKRSALIPHHLVKPHRANKLSFIRDNFEMYFNIDIQVEFLKLQCHSTSPQSLRLQAFSYTINEKCYLFIK